MLAVADQHLVAAVKAFRNCSPGGPESHKILAADPDVLEENHEELCLELLQLQRRMTISFLPVSRAQHFVRTSAVEMNMNMSQRGFTGKMPDASNTTSIEHQTLTLTVRTLSVATLFGENTKTQIPPVWGSTHWFSLCEMIRNHGVFKRLGVCIPSIVYVMDLYAWLLQLPGHVSM